MKITIVAVGKMGRGPYQDLFDRFQKRLDWTVSLVEVDDRGKATGARRQAAEAAKITAAIPEGAVVIALDERGKTLSSREISKKLEHWQLEGQGTICFVVGGADGLTDDVRMRADLLLSFGRATWPHMLARVMLIEQLYRSWALLKGHPYHRD